jgi:hypothetical protein
MVGEPRVVELLCDDEQCDWNPLSSAISPTEEGLPCGCQLLAHSIGVVVLWTLGTGRMTAFAREVADVVGVEGEPYGTVRGFTASH